MPEGTEVTVAGAWNKLAGEVYGDLAKPSVQAVGRAIGDVFELLPWATSWGREWTERRKVRLAHNLEKFRKELENTPPENATPIPPEIAIPILERFCYVSDEEIASLFAKLLASASTAATAANAHPSFIHIIDNLSPDEAVLLKYMAGMLVPFVDTQIASAATERSGTWLGVRELGTLLAEQCQFTFPQNVPIYLNNLSGQGLVLIDRVNRLEPKEVYDRLEAAFMPEAKKHVTWKLPHARAARGYAKLTPYGTSFVQTCTGINASSINLSPHDSAAL